MTHEWENVQLPLDDLPSVRPTGGTADKYHFRTISCFVILGCKVF